MAKTPKNVRWDLEMSPSEFGSPFEGNSTDSVTSTSSLQYVNSQLLAHGFAHGSGLSLDGLGKEDTEKVVKCLLGMLSQRIDDMSRTEELATKLRTTSYEHERLSSMLKTANDRASNAEREMNMHKSRLASANQMLQSAETAHKRTSAELQRTRSALQSLRATHLAEIKKIEKEKERMMDRWNKLADNQLKLGSQPSGIKFANAQVVEASEVQLHGKGQGFLEVALEQAEQSRSQLADEIRSLRGIVLSTANELQRILHIARCISSPELQDEPQPLTVNTLFPLSPANAASEKLTSLLISTKDLIEKLAHSHAALVRSSSAQAPSNKPKEQVDRQKVDKLNTIIENLHKELDEAKKQSSAYAAEAKELLSRLTQHSQSLPSNGGSADMDVDLNTAPVRNKEQGRADMRSRGFEEERRKVIEDRTGSGKEKATFKAGETALTEERRQRQVPSTSNEPTSSTATPKASQPPLRTEMPVAAAPISPRRSPRKVKVGGSKKTRISRRSSGAGGLSPRRSKVVPAFETEVVPPKITTTNMPQPQFSTSLAASPAPAKAVSTAFTLPPPSPAATIKPSNGLLSSALPPLPSLDIPKTASIPSDVDMKSSEPADGPSAPSTVPSSSSASSLPPPQPPVPQTPGVRRPFPVAKPLAAHMVHAYSPVKPSPLSRILMMASPDSPESLSNTPPLQTLPEEDESPDFSPTPAIGLGPPPKAQKRKAPMPSLAAELGLEDSDEESNPLWDKPPVSRNKDKNQIVSTEQRRLTAKEKGKARADPLIPQTRLRTATVVEKENKIKRLKTSSSTSVNVHPSTSKAASGGNVKKSTTKREKVAMKVAPKTSGSSGVTQRGLNRVKGGARRVPIDSVEAAPVAKVWKG